MKKWKQKTEETECGLILSTPGHKGKLYVVDAHRIRLYTTASLLFVKEKINDNVTFRNNALDKN